MARANPLFPQSGMPGVQWQESRRKWTVRFKANGREFYYGLYDDLDEARLVLTSARLEHDPKARAREDSTAHLSDAEIAERFGLDEDSDPVWLPKPLAGSEATIRDNARWNMRHAGRKLDERAKFNRTGLTRAMWRKDIVQRLVAVDSKQGGGIPPEAEPAVPRPTLNQPFPRPSPWLNRPFRPTKSKGGHPAQR